MKLGFGKRVVLILQGLLSLLLVGLLCFREKAEPYLAKLKSLVAEEHIQLVWIGAAIVYAVLSLAVIAIALMRKRKPRDKGFIIVDASETGNTKISVSAVDQMIRQAAHTVEGVAEMKTGITSTEDAIDIHLNVSLLSGSHVPTVTLNLQRAIRQYVEINCGVSVRTVSVNIITVVNQMEHSRRGRRAENKAEVAQPVISRINTDAQPADLNDEPLKSTEPIHLELQRSEVMDAVGSVESTDENEVEATNQSQPDTDEADYE